MVTAAAVVWILTMGLCRVFLGHHWLTDVITGWLLGLAWVLVLVVCHRLWLTIKRHHATSTPPATVSADAAAPAAGR